MQQKKLAVFKFETPSGEVKVIGQYRGRRHSAPDFIQKQFMRSDKLGPLLDVTKTHIRYVTMHPVLDPHNCERRLSVDEYFAVRDRRRRKEA
jgi:hypothetical protein